MCCLSLCLLLFDVSLSFDECCFCLFFVVCFACCLLFASCCLLSILFLVCSFFRLLRRIHRVMIVVPTVITTIGNGCWLLFGCCFNGCLLAFLSDSMVTS